MPCRRPHRSCRACSVCCSGTPATPIWYSTCALPWLHLSRRFPEAAIPLACLAVTVELGGMADTERPRAEASAEQILAFLAEQGLIAGDWPSAPEPCCEATPFA